MQTLANELVYSSGALLCAATSAVYDVRTRRIPNFITLPAFVFGVALHAVLGGWKEIATSTVAGILCFAAFLLFYLAGGMGAGDVKLMMAVGCIGGLPLVAHQLVLTALAGGAMAIGLALSRGQLTRTLTNMYSLAVHHQAMGLRPHPEFHIGNDSTLRLPYALAIAAGSASTLCLLVMQR